MIAKLALSPHGYQFSAWREFLISSFDTHQVGKGLEFPRVMVILNGEEAGGFLFSYDKLLGVKPASDRVKNQHEGKDDSSARSRLLYVTCSRA